MTTEAVRVVEQRQVRVAGLGDNAGAGERDYVIHIGAGLLARAGELCTPLLAGARRVVIITQPPVQRHFAAPLVRALQSAGLRCDVAAFPDGETHKTLATVETLYQQLYELRADRKTLVVALGGGVVGDVAGFVAASYNRGLPYVQIPTTLLAMVDSSVGGKTGVDFAQGKNLIGAFYQPRAVIADLSTLQTLPEREIRSGLAEVVKYGAIRDPSLLGELRAGLPNGEGLARIVERSCRIKADVVAGDEREETGLRAILNFGHTVGHALESATNYCRYRHGEAIAIGMVAAACIGEAAGVSAPSVRPALVSALEALGLPVVLPGDVDQETIMNLLSLDKKTEAGRVRWVLLRELGRVVPGCVLDDAVVRAGLARHASEYGAQ